MAFVTNISEVANRVTERGNAAASRFRSSAICKAAI
jgi:hypothetical protein